MRRYHEKQKQDSWQYREADGTLLGQQVTPLDRAGIYVPGGKAAYPSSVLMNALPARVAGVGEIVMVSPAPDGELNDMVLAAAAVAGVERFFTLGGAQAVGALAFGTETVPAVDKIVGPGNIYLAEAKRQVFGKVGIDMIAGPSEILVVCDGKTDPDWIATDLPQAEHDEEAQSTVSPTRISSPEWKAMERLAPTLEREAVIRTSMANRGALTRWTTWTRPWRWSTASARSTWSCPWTTPRSGRRKCATPVPSSGPSHPGALGDRAGPNHVLPAAPPRGFVAAGRGRLPAQLADRLLAGGRQRAGQNRLGAVPRGEPHDHARSAGNEDQEGLRRWSPSSAT